MERTAPTSMRTHVLATASATVAVLLATAGSGEPAWGAVDLEAVINMDVDFAQFRTAYSDRVEYAYGEGSLLHQHLGGRQWVVEGTTSEGQGVQNLEDMLDTRFVWKSGSAKISVSNVGYELRLDPTSYGSAMERTVWITGSLTGYITNATTIFHPPADTMGTQPAWAAYAFGCDDYVPGTQVNIRWLGPTVTDDIVIDGVPINMPASLLREMEPEAYGLLAGTEADVILNRPLMDAGPIRDHHADAWHSRIYTAGTSVEADTFGLSGGVTDVDVYTWTIDVDGPAIGTKGVDVATITRDQTYVIRSMHDMSSATIRTIGAGVFDTVDGVEVVSDSQFATTCKPYVNPGSAEPMVFVFIVFTLTAIIALILIVAHRRNRRLSRNDDGLQAKAAAPP